MTPKRRTPKDTDQEVSEKAYELLLSFLAKNQTEIEPALWWGPMICALAENSKSAGFTKELFIKEMATCTNAYANQVWKE